MLARMANARRFRPGRSDVVLATWSLLLGVVALAPLVRPGYVLSYDMVAVPDQAVLPSSVGITSAMPRAVPLDAVVAVLDSAVSGAVLQRVALLGVVAGAAFGAGRALPGVGTGTRLVAASVYGWNAYVFERLVIGHWPTLVAYAVLPWLLVAGRHVRAGQAGAAARGVLLVGLASLTATGGLIASGLFVGLVLAPGGRQRQRTRVVVTVGAALLQAPWAIPGIVRSEPAVSDPAGVAAFAAEPDSPLGLLGSLVTMGGIWNDGAVPGSRSLISSALLSMVLVVLAVVGARGLRRLLGRAETGVLGGLAIGGFVLALVGAVPGGRDVAEWLITNVAGAGLFRDGQKFLAFYALVVALAAAVGVARIVAVTPWGPAGRRAVAAAAVLLPMAALPDLAFGAVGRLAPVEYPREWSDVRSVLRESSAEADLVVLPFQPFRSFPWAGDRTVLDPAPRYFGVETVVPDALPVGGAVVSGEDPRAEGVGEALNDERPMQALAEAGIGWIVVQHDTPGEVPDRVVDAADTVTDTDPITLLRVPGPVEPWTDRPMGPPIVAANIVSLVILAGASGDLVRKACLRKRWPIRSPVS